MTVNVWDREKKQIIRQKIPMGKALWFLYHTKPGRIVFLRPMHSRFAAALSGMYMKSRLSAGKIRSFSRAYPPNHQKYEKNTGEYASFNDFFTRKLIAAQELVDMSRDILVSPADSQVAVYDIHDGLVVPVKGSRYTLAELLQNDPAREKYAGGKCLVFRLAPHNYHRYCYPDSGRQSDVVTIKGKLHSVNPIAVHGKIKVYAQNYRQYVTLHTENFGDVIQMEIGAMLIGKIRNHHMTARGVKKGMEKGFFEYGGSAVILLVREGYVEIDPDIAANSTTGMETAVGYGEKIGVKIDLPGN